jgi:hypothetical protein
MEPLEKILKELRDSVWAGEHEPIVGIQFQQRVNQLLGGSLVASSRMVGTSSTSRRAPLA